MLYNLETSKQPSAAATAKDVSAMAVDILYKNDVAFSGKTIEIPYGATRIRPYIFNDCWPEKAFNVKLPNTVTEIMDKAFANCDIDSLYLSPNITKLPSHAFDDCNIKTLYMYHATSKDGYPWSYEDISFKIQYLD